MDMFGMLGGIVMLKMLSNHFLGRSGGVIVIVIGVIHG